MSIARIRELLDEKEYPIPGDSPLARYALELRNEIGPLLDRVEKLEGALKSVQGCFDTWDQEYKQIDAALRGEGE